MLPIRKWRESLRDLRRLEVEGAMVAVWCSDVVVEEEEMRRCDDGQSWHVNVNVEAGARRRKC